MNKVTRITLAPTVLEHPMLFGNGSRLGLRVIGPGGQPMYIEGWQLYVLFRTMERHLLLSSSLSREALLEVARQHKHKLPPPSWWSDATKGGSELSRAPEELTPAPDPIINQVIGVVYDATDAAGTKPPNIKELPAAVHSLLEQKGLRASGQHIQELGEAPEFKRRRRPPGKTVASERRKE
jgi:hypothetical protein